MAYGGGQPNINQEMIKCMRIQLPPLKEQELIITHLETLCTSLDTIIKKFKKQIELYKEYRQTLISEVINGKIDVRGEVAI